MLILKFWINIIAEQLMETHRTRQKTVKQAEESSSICFKNMFSKEENIVLKTCISLGALSSKRKKIASESSWSKAEGKLLSSHQS